MTTDGATGTVVLVRVVTSLLDWFRRRSPSAVVVDAALAAVLGVVTVVSALVQGELEDQRLTAVGLALLALEVVPLVWRRRAPLVVATVSIAAAAAYGMAELPDPAVLFGPLLAFYTVAASRPRSVSLPFAVAVLGGSALCAAAVGGGDADAADIAVGYFSAITAWVVGDTTRGQRERTAWLEQRRAESARQAARDERLRIARDLHDVVAHHVSVIAVQAEAAQEVMTSQPDRASAAMASAADTARTALGELRRMLGVLRSDQSLAPQPDLDTVDELVESVRHAGLPVSVRTTGEPRPVAASVGLTVYRVVQEALTNVLKHAGTCRAEVRLEFGDDELLVTVVDDGTGSPASPPSAAGNGRGGGRSGGHGGGGGGGHGLVGMRERVAAVGGRFAAGPAPGGGFEVSARLPLGRDSSGVAGPSP
jgi:signal transduction histidine kinase